MLCSGSSLRGHLQLANLSLRQSPIVVTAWALLWLRLLFGLLLVLRWLRLGLIEVRRLAMRSV
jgi:hypothetical protein